MTFKEDLIKEMEEGKGLGARLAARELAYVKSLWMKLKD